MPGWDESEQLVHCLSAVYLSEVADCGSGLAITSAGGSDIPLNVAQNIASPVPSAIWLAAVPPMIDWWKLSLEVYLSARPFNIGASPSCTLEKPIELAPESSPRAMPT